MRDRALTTSYTDTDAAPVLLLAPPIIAADAMQAIEVVGARLLDHIDWPGGAGALGRYAVRPLVMIETEGVPDATLDRDLPVLATWSDARDLPVVVALAEEQIDRVSAHLLGPRVQLLCGASLSDRIVALTIGVETLHGAILHDSWRESDSVRLRRLHEEVARIAGKLIDLARPDREVDGDIRDRRGGYDSGPGGSDAIAASDVRRAIRSRRLRDQFLGEGLFEDPAWDMLLDLYAAELEGTRVSVSSLCIASAVAPTTALRWIARLTESGLLVRQPDPDDRRRAFMALSQQTSDALGAYMVALKRMDLQIA